MAVVTPELLDERIDQTHRAFKRVQEGTAMSVLRTRHSRNVWALDRKWFERLAVAGLLPFCRMMQRSDADEAGDELEDDEAGELELLQHFPRFPLNRHLLTALVDRWRPETHTFHLSCGEMALTLQDVSMLLGLPLRGMALVLDDLPLEYDWVNDLLLRFHQVLPAQQGIQQAEIHENKKRGPTLQWLEQFELNRMVDDPTDYQVARHLEAYLLWLFGWVMFTNSNGSFVDARFIPIARAIADGNLEAIPSYSWGSAVLAATLRGLCLACCRNGENSVLTGCPMFVMLWSLERFTIGRPSVDATPYGDAFYGDVPVDGPTVGSLWCRRKVTWARHGVVSMYEYFVERFDHLKDTDIVWEPYPTPGQMYPRAPQGLSPQCFQDSQFWLTRRKLVYDVFVEDHFPNRVMRQFGLQQNFPIPTGDRVPDHVHRYTRRGGNPKNSTWVQTMQKWVDEWKDAPNDVFPQNEVHCPVNFRAYLQWYTPRTRVRLLRVDDKPDTLEPRTITDTYSPALRSSLHIAIDEHVRNVKDGVNMMVRMSRQDVTRDDLEDFVRRVVDHGVQTIWRASCVGDDDVQMLNRSSLTPMVVRPTPHSPLPARSSPPVHSGVYMGRPESSRAREFDVGGSSTQGGRPSTFETGGILRPVAPPSPVVTVAVAMQPTNVWPPTFPTAFAPFPITTYLGTIFQTGAAPVFTSPTPLGGFSRWARRPTGLQQGAIIVGGTSQHQLSGYQHPGAFQHQLSGLQHPGAFQHLSGSAAQGTHTLPNPDDDDFVDEDLHGQARFESLLATGGYPGGSFQGNGATPQNSMSGMHVDGGRPRREAHPPERFGPSGSRQTRPIKRGRH